MVWIHISLRDLWTGTISHMESTIMNLKDYEKNLFTWCKSSIGNYKNTKKKNRKAYEDMIKHNYDKRET